MQDPGKQSALQELRTAYLRSLPGKMSSVSEALAMRDFQSISRLAHQLKGSGLSYGYPAVSEFGVRLEEAAENRRVTVLESLLIEFRDLMEQVTRTALPSEKL